MNKSDLSVDSPDLPPFRLGITGHRGHRLSASARAGVPLEARQFLIALRDALKRPIVVMSPLADGADQLVAEVALEIGLPLHCPLPFAIADYEHDFTAGAQRETFLGLLARASSVDVLPGIHETSATRNAAYAALGQYLIRNSDAILAIWDGSRANGPGGTADVVAQATVASVPVIRLNATATQWFSLVPASGTGASLEPSQMSGEAAGRQLGIAMSSDQRGSITLPCPRLR